MSARHFAPVYRLAEFLLFTLLLSAALDAQITPLADSYTDSALPTTNYGAKTLLDVDGATQITYIQFNLASIPSGASVTQATLKLYVNSVTTAGSFNVDYVNGSWSESKIDYSNAPPLGTAIASNVAITTADKNQYILIDVTSALQAWLNGSETNYGLALVANSTFNATFDSKESTTTSHPPELDVVFAPGSGGGTITGVLTGTGSGLQGGGTSGTLNISLLTSCANGQVLAWNGSAWACTNMGSGGGGGTVTSVALTAPSTDFLVTGSPVTTSGTLGLGWLVAPDFNNTPNAIVKRDSNGNFSAGAINAVNSFNLGGNVFDQGNYANYNAFTGFAGNSTMTGLANTGSGYQALLSNTTGQGNTAFGDQALSGNTAGNGNLALGGHTLFSNTTGQENTAVGGRAIYDAQTGSYNTAVGNSALYSTSIGSNNTAVGLNALYYNTTGSNNTALGYEAAYDSTQTGLTNATAIGAQSDVTQSNSLVLGSINGVNGATANTNVGIGTTAPQYALDVHGTGNFTGTVNFASGQTFTGVAELGTANIFTGNQTVNGNVSATGVVTGSSFQIGSNLFDYGSYVNGDAFLGFAGNGTAAGGANTATGYQALMSNTSGGYNTANGMWALEANTTGTNNVAVGYSALYANTTASNNVAVGSNALASNTSGGSNTASGSGALAFNTTGSNNTAMGENAMLSNSTGYSNTASGTQALYSNQYGYGNTATGTGSMFSNVLGSNNTGTGMNALYNNASGSNNTALGSNAGPDSNSTTLTNSTAIGANAVVSESNALVLGGTGSNAVSVGIGTAKPAYTLDVQGGGRFTQPVVFASSQTFPGAGTITGVTAGTGLSGGGTSGAVTLNNTGILGVTAGTGISSSGGQTPTITNTGILGVTQGTGISVSSGQNPTIGINTSVVPQLNASTNTFTGSMNVKGGLSAPNGNFPGNAPVSIGTFGGEQTMSNTGDDFFVLMGNIVGIGAWGDGGTTTGNVGIVGTVDNGSAGVFVNDTQDYNTLVAYDYNGAGAPLSAWNANGNGCTLDQDGYWSCTGGGLVVVQVDGGQRKVALSAVGSPKNWFEDFGSAQLSNGSAVVSIEPEYGQTVNTQLEYHVFLTPNGDCKGLYISHRTPTSFEVRELGGGTSNIEFSYRIVALRKNKENIRLKDHTNDPDPIKMMAARKAARPPVASEPEQPRQSELKTPKPPLQAALPEPPKVAPLKLAPPKLPTQPRVPEPPSQNPSVAPKTVKSAEPQK